MFSHFAICATQYLVQIVCNMHFALTLRVIYYAFCITHFKLCIMHNALCNMHLMLSITHNMLCITHHIITWYALHIMHNTVCIIHYTLLILHYAICKTHYELSKIHYALHIMIYLESNNLMGFWIFIPYFFFLVAEQLYRHRCVCPSVRPSVCVSVPDFVPDLLLNSPNLQRSQVGPRLLYFGARKGCTVLFSLAQTHLGPSGVRALHRT
jgi:hypothetical protein